MLAGICKPVMTIEGQVHSFLAYNLQYKYTLQNSQGFLMQASTFSFRADEVFSEQTRAMAQALGLKSSDYIRQAVTEKNAQVMAQRIAALSRELAEEHLRMNESLEGTLSDGID